MSPDTGAQEQALFAAKSVLLPAARQAEALAASTGTAVTIKTAIYVDDGSKNWPTTLATVLCDKPELASGNRQAMADLLTAELRLEQPFTANRLSKPLTTEAKTMVRAILNEHGYECSTLTNGLSIRDIVSDNRRTGFAKPTTISTKFYADRIEMDGVAFKYRQRDRPNPTGNAWQDFSLRIRVSVATADIPLLAILKLRNIGIGEFINADKAAVESATAEELTRRQSLNAISG